MAAGGDDARSHEDMAAGLLCMLSSDPVAAKELSAAGAVPVLASCLRETQLLCVVAAPTAATLYRVLLADPSQVCSLQAVGAIEPLLSMIRGGVSPEGREHMFLREAASEACRAVRALLTAGCVETSHSPCYASNFEVNADSGGGDSGSSGSGVAEAHASNAAAQLLHQAGGIETLVGILRNPSREFVVLAAEAAEAMLDVKCRQAARSLGAVPVFMALLDKPTLLFHHPCLRDRQARGTAARCLG